MDSVSGPAWADRFAITTDYRDSRGSPEPALRQIAAAGWKRLHWCHHWNDDHLYAPAELRQIGAWLDELGLGVLDIHGSNGQETAWDSAREPQRRAGVELVRNRLEMAARLRCEVVIMHPARGDGAEGSIRLDSLRRSLDELMPDLARFNVRLAMENMAHPNTFDQLERLLAAYPPDRLGICYDPGHGCIAGNGLDRLETVADRLIALHLNDNDGVRDLHQPPFAGKVDWPRLARIIHRSGYRRSGMSVEAVIAHFGTADDHHFLLSTLLRAGRFGQMCAEPPAV